MRVFREGRCLVTSLSVMGCRNKMGVVAIAAVCLLWGASDVRVFPVNVPLPMVWQVHICGCTHGAAQLEAISAFLRAAGVKCHCLPRPPCPVLRPSPQETLVWTSVSALAQERQTFTLVSPDTDAVLQEGLPVDHVARCALESVSKTAAGSLYRSLATEVATFVAVSPAPRLVVVLGGKPEDPVAVRQWDVEYVEGVENVGPVVLRWLEKQD